MSSPAAHDGRSWSIARLASGTLVLLALAGSHMDVSLLPAGTSRPAASASLLTEEQMGRFQVRIRGMGPQGIASEAPDRPVNEAPPAVKPIQRVEPTAEPPAKPAGAAAVRAPAEEPRWKAAGRDAGTVPRAVALAVGMEALRTALAETKGRIEELERSGGQR